jgi:hypothetical protein
MKQLTNKEFLELANMYEAHIAEIEVNNYAPNASSYGIKIHEHVCEDTVSKLRDVFAEYSNITVVWEKHYETIVPLPWEPRAYPSGMDDVEYPEDDEDDTPLS